MAAPDKKLVSPAVRQGRVTVLILLTVLTTVSLILDFLSDVLIAPHHQVTKALDHTTYETSVGWDITGGIFVAVWGLVALLVWFEGAKVTHDRPTRGG